MIRRAAVAAALFASLSTAPVRADESPRAIVQQVTDQALAVLADKSTDAAEKRRRLEQITYAHVDFETLSRLVLGQNWNRFSDAQKQAFVEEFKRHLSMTYGRNIESYHNEKVAIVGERDEPRGDHTVQTKILRGGGADDIAVDYRLRQTNGRWQIIDFVIENISLVANFRSQFQEMLASGTPDGLIKTLHERNERGEPLKAPKAS